MKRAIAAAHRQNARPKKQPSADENMKRLVKRAAHEVKTESKPHPYAAIRIRRGGASDVPVILTLIRGLADYERLTREVEAMEAGREARRHAARSADRIIVSARQPAARSVRPHYRGHGARIGRDADHARPRALGLRRAGACAGGGVLVP